MNYSFAKMFLVLALLGLLVQGYDCGSPEMTGARVYMTQKNYKAAAEQLEKEVKKNPGNEEAWFLLGSIKGEFSDYEGMNAAYNECLKIDPTKHGREIHDLRRSKWGGHINSGVSHMNGGSTTNTAPYDSAVAEYRKAVAAWPDTFLTYRYLAYAYNDKGDEENAIQSFSTAWNLGKQGEDGKAAGRIYLFRGAQFKSQFETANAEKIKLKHSLDDVDKGWSKTDVLRLLGAPENKKPVKGSKKEDWQYIKYNLSLTFDGDRVVARSMSKPYDAGIDSTNLVAAKKEFGAAGGWLEKAREKNPKDNDLLKLLLQVYIETGRTKEAIGTYIQASENDPSNKVIFYVLGHLYRSDNQYDNSIKSFEKSLALDENYADAMMELGTTYYNWGVEILRVAQEKNSDDQSYKEKLKKALPYFEKYTQLSPGEPLVWETLANIYGRTGQTDKAVKAIEEADRIRKGEK